MSNQEFEQLLLNSYTYKINVADVVKGVVVKKEKDGYLVDIGAKTEAFLPNREISNFPDKNVDEVIKLWDEKEFYIIKDEEDDVSQQIHRRCHDVFNDRHVREEIKGLEHHTHLLPDLADITFFIGDTPTHDPDLSGGRRLQQIDASDQSGFSCAGGTDDRNHVPLMNFRANIFERSYVEISLL